MWAIAVVVYAVCKGFTWQQAQTPQTPLWKHAAYLLAWPGLDAPAFLTNSTVVSKPCVAEWMFAVIKAVAGVVVLAFARSAISVFPPYLAGWLGMIGIVMVLHFGLFHVLSCLWRQCGINARPLMHWPLASASVTEFWGRRWNTAFRDLTHRFLFRPLTARFGPRAALVLGFVFSGLVHDLVISVPAGGGYGGPTVFFLSQGVALFFERSSIGRWLGLGQGLRGWLFTAITLMLPAPLLFHRSFVERIVVPFVSVLG